jgi:hypothetical protein
VAAFIKEALPRPKHEELSLWNLTEKGPKIRCSTAGSVGLFVILANYIHIDIYYNSQFEHK